MMNMLADRPAMAGEAPKRSVATFDMTMVSSRKTVAFKKLIRLTTRKSLVHRVSLRAAAVLVALPTPFLSPTVSVPSRAACSGAGRPPGDSTPRARLQERVRVRAK